MSQPEPQIACSLGAGEKAQRRDDWAVLRGRGLLGASVSARGASVRFRREAEVQLRELIEAESRCCAFLDFDLRHEGESLRLSVTGPPSARPNIRELFGLQGDTATEPRASRGRIPRMGGAPE